MMKRRMGMVVALLMTVLIVSPQAQQNQRPQPPPSIDDRTNGMKKLDGYFPLYWD
jgi:outer membrane lipoprotein-sorting protein